MIAVLGVSQRDHLQAVKWLSWVSALNRSEAVGGDFPVSLLIVCVKRLNVYQLQMLREAAGNMRPHWATLPDENEVGYPKSASHLFLRAMEHCEKHHPGEHILWVEADTVPLCSGWREAIAAEYAACGKPFMGVIERGHGFAHMAGVGVYPPDWRAKAPLLADVLNAGDIFWGPGLGQAFDTYAAPQTVPQCAQAKTIQQIWRPTLPITEPWMRTYVRAGVVLFHQVKDGSGFTVANEILRRKAKNG